MTRQTHTFDMETAINAIPDGKDLTDQVIEARYAWSLSIIISGYFF